MTTNRPEWIAALKVGDRVAIRYYVIGKISHRILKVTGVTSTGRIKIGARTFRPDGEEMGEHGYGGGATLVQVTPEIERNIRADRIRDLLTGHRWHFLTDDQAIAAAEALKAAGIAGWES
ncbi:MAG: hypothetical protein KGR26_15970 [Cyanobacteria bacterium REEB65]|nr:hypothetical protein [Cyanobacteria bacterium REEB65]